MIVVLLQNAQLTVLGVVDVLDLWVVFVVLAGTFFQSLLYSTLALDGRRMSLSANGTLRAKMKAIQDRWALSSWVRRRNFTI